MRKVLFFLVVLLADCGLTPGGAQEARLRPADLVSLPGQTDGNSASFWRDGRLNVFTSIGWPLKINTADSQFNPWESCDVDVSELPGMTLWMEAAWADADGVVFGWYHHEPGFLYPDSWLTIPKIGAVVSFDGGKTIHNLGIILESGYAPDDTAQNGFFTGGHGDFSVVLDRERKYFYIFFSNYGGPAEHQGVAVARMAFEDRFNPAGKVYKYCNGAWTEPGLGGMVTPVFPVVRSWHFSDPDAFWGPSVHWNTYLGCFVMFLNHASGEPGWNQEGIYVSFAYDLGNPESWRAPKRILSREELPSWAGFYPQVMGLEAGGTDTLAGRTARFYVSGGSVWEIDFLTINDAAQVNPIDWAARRNLDH